MERSKTVLLFLVKSYYVQALLLTTSELLLHAKYRVDQ